MSGCVFQSDGNLPGCPATVLAAGDCVVWRRPSNAECLSVLDLLTGITHPPAGAVCWFGRDLSQLATKEILDVLQRLVPLTPSGGLIGNIRMEENILLACEARGRGEAGAVELREVLHEPPWSEWFPERQLRSLPYQTGDLERSLAGVLRAGLVRPEAIVACNVFHLLEHGERATLAAALSWLRARHPACAWLFVQTESALPPGFSGNSLDRAP